MLNRANLLRAKHQRTYAIVAATVASLAISTSGCGGNGGGAVGSVGILPQSATITRGQTQQFQGSYVDFAPRTTTWRVVESDGGTIAVGSASDGSDPNTAIYTAPSQTGQYHVQFLLNAGQSSQITATATVRVN